MKRKLLWALLGIVLTVPSAGLAIAQSDHEPEDEAKQASKSCAELKQEFEAARAAAMEELGKATSREEQNKIFNEKMPKATEFVPRFWAVVEQDPATEDACLGLIWLLQNNPQLKEQEKTLDLLMLHHKESEEIAEICSLIADSRIDSVEGILRELMEESPHAKVQGHAAFALATRCKKADADEAERLFQLVMDEYSSFEHPYKETLGQAADAELFELKHLQIGKVVPDIVAKDTDGVEFKLSDYRGKVILLDFWGHW